MNKEELNAHRKGNPIYKNIQLKYRYGITLDKYKELLAKQEDKCKICKTHQSGLKKKLSVDHDHSCCPGKKSCGECIRGLLCSACNHAIGLLKDNKEYMFNAIIYLGA